VQLRLVQLPSKPSKLIELALADLAACEESPVYVIDMVAWHHASEGGACHVCLAGAVMAQSLGIDPAVSFSPTSLPADVHLQLLALDLLRTGMVWSALAHLGISRPPLDIEEYALVRPYQRSRPGLFRNDMAALSSLVSPASEDRQAYCCK
jgi:hypothetical protein